MKKMTKAWRVDNVYRKRDKIKFLFFPPSGFLLLHDYATYIGCVHDYK